MRPGFLVTSQPGLLLRLMKAEQKQVLFENTARARGDAPKDKDMVTYNMALTILQQEVEHEEDLQSLREDLDLMVQRGSK
jgi:ferritin-like protein